MNIFFNQLNSNSCRSYLVGVEKSNEVIIIDPVLDFVNQYLELLNRNKLKLTHVVDTHTHADHISGGALLKDKTGCEYVMHAKAPAKCIGFRLEDGMDFKAGSISFKVIHTPGHTKDSVTLIFENCILTGDILFLDDGGAGRDDLPGGDPAEHWDSLQRIITLPEHLVVYPGHDYRNRRPSSLKEQKLRNPHLKHKTKNEFVQYLEDLKLGPADWMKEVLKANYNCACDSKGIYIPEDVSACEVGGNINNEIGEDIIANITPQELKKRIDLNHDIVLLDVRELRELTSELGHLSGIKHIPIGSLSIKLPELQAYKDKDIITICRSGARATAAAQMLMQSGFKKVYVLSGGMIKWKQAGLPIKQEL
jgi:glyoxylase-like metal-dependent hydrolase (beta-lactamase superfamily II)/rhodanese-related sulfurtransferase